MTPPPSPDLSPLDGVARTAVAGVCVGGQLQVRARGGVDGASVFRIASLTKTLTAVATLRALERAGAGLQTPVIDVLPDLAPDWRADRRVTVAHVLSQTSGLAATVGSADVAALGEGPSALLEAARLVVRAGSARPPGQRWEYDNGNYFLAGAVLAALHGASYEQAVQELVLDPTGTRGTSFPPPQDLVPGRDGGALLPAVRFPRGRRPSGGLCSSVDDLLAVGADLLNDAALLERTASPAHTSGYGLGWALGPSGQLHVNGRLPGYRAAMVLVPDHALIGVVLTDDSRALPAAATVLSALQEESTGDDLAAAVTRFAA